MLGRQTSHLNAVGRSRLSVLRGESEDTPLARASLLLMSFREWEGNGVSHDVRKDMRASLF